EPDRPALEMAQISERIGAYAHEAGMAKRDKPGIADEEVDAEHEDHENRDLDDDREPVWAGKERRQKCAAEQQEENRKVEGGARRHQCAGLTGTRPRGRTSSTPAMTAYMMNDENAGTSTGPKVSAMPMMNAPRTAPLRLPGPPMTTTTSAG